MDLRKPERSEDSKQAQARLHAEKRVVSRRDMLKLALRSSISDRKTILVISGTVKPMNVKVIRAYSAHGTSSVSDPSKRQ
jgi:hypothetical protein